MQLTLLKAKLHKATVTEANLNYTGSITIDKTLLEQSGILVWEKVSVVNNNNGQRFETYVIEGEAGSGTICLNGAAARCAAVGDVVILMAYAQLTPEEAAAHRPQVVFVNAQNHITRVTRYEKHGKLGG